MSAVLERIITMLCLVALISCSQTDFGGGGVGNAFSKQGKEADEEEGSGFEAEADRDGDDDSSNDADAGGKGGLDQDADTGSSSAPNQVDPKDGLDISEDEAKIYREPLQIEFRRFADKAALTNCVRLKMNNEPEVEVGCNKDPVNRVTTLNVLRKPHCNVLSIRLYSNGSLNFSSENPANVRVENNALENLAYFRGVKLFRENDNVLLGLVNDNGDDKNHSDTTFRLIGLSAINFRVENSGETCN